MTGEGFKTFGEILKQIDGFVWGSSYCIDNLQVFILQSE